MSSRHQSKPSQRLRVPDMLTPPVVILARNASDGMTLAEGDPILRIRDATGREGFLRAQKAGTVRYEPTATPGAERPLGAVVATVTRVETPTAPPEQDPDAPEEHPDDAPPTDAPERPELDVLRTLAWGGVIALAIGAASIDLSGDQIRMKIEAVLLFGLLASAVLGPLAIGARRGSLRLRAARALALLALPALSGYWTFEDAKSYSPDGILPRLLATTVVEPMRAAQIEADCQVQFDYREYSLRFDACAFRR